MFEEGGDRGRDRTVGGHALKVWHLWGHKLLMEDGNYR